MTGAAPQSDLGQEYRQKVKALAVRQKLKRVFVDDTVLSTSPHANDADSDTDSEANRVGSSDTLDDLEMGTLGLHTAEDGPAARYFALFDTDQDGFVGREDLRLGITTLMSAENGISAGSTSPSSGGEESAKTKICPGVHMNIDELFDIIDTDKEGRINLEKFQCFYDIVILPSTIRRRNST